MDIHRSRLAAWGLGLFAATFGMTGEAAGTLAQATGTLHGVVTDAGSGAPIPDAEVSVAHLGLTAATDESGAYTLIGVPAGRHTLLVRGAGFKPAVARYHVVMPDTVNLLDFALDAVAPPDEAPRDRPYPSADAVVFSTFIRRDELPANTDLLEALGGRIPGSGFGPPQAPLLVGERLQRRAVPGGAPGRVRWVVDGRSVTTRTIMSVNTADVWCIEIRGGGVTAAAFDRAPRAPGGATESGVVRVWTARSQHALPEGCWDR